MKSAVLLLTFNRAENAAKVLDTIREAKVAKLYISNDGPRAGNTKDAEARSKIQEMVKTIDWDCEVHTLFFDENMGCGRAVSSAITWAFTNEDRLIILEDDCVPSRPFYELCDYCLEKYKDDNRVWTINGRSQHENDPAFHGYDYTFSLYGHCWGWATWKRVWEGFDITTPYIEQFLKEGGMKNVFHTKKEARLATKMYIEPILHNPMYYKSSWATPFGIYLFSNRALTITPRLNLIHNIGMEGDHSNVKSKKIPYYYTLQASETYTFNNEPLFVLSNADYCNSHYEKHMHKMYLKRYSISRVFRAFKILKEKGLRGLIDKIQNA